MSTAKAKTLAKALAKVKGATCGVCRRSIPATQARTTIFVSAEGRRSDQQATRVAWSFCEKCAATLDLEDLPLPRVRGCRGRELGELVVEALGKPWKVVHNDDDLDPHIDVFVYKPGILPGWTLLTVGRSAQPVDGRRLELAVQIPDELDADQLDEIDHAAVELRLLALRGCDDLRWRLRPLHAERLDRLGSALPTKPLLLEAVFRKAGGGV